MNSEEKKCPDKGDPAIRILMMPSDANAAGDIFGGWIMAQVDIAGAVIAARETRGRVVTVAVTDFQFKKPVLVGDLVSCYGEVVKVGRTSITIDVCVYAERVGLPAGGIKVTDAKVVYVAVDENREPRVIERK